MCGWLYAQLLNRLKGEKMSVTTYVGFSIVSLMCIAWLVLPFQSLKLRWPLGTGLRNTIGLSTERGFKYALDGLWSLPFVQATYVLFGVVVVAVVVLLVLKKISVKKGLVYVGLMAALVALRASALAEAPDMLSDGLEKTVEGVKYTLGYMLEDDVIILVNVRAEKL